MKYLYTIISFVIGLLVAITTIIFYRDKFTLALTDSSFIIIGAFLMAFLCIYYIFNIAQKSKGDATTALGMPNGSVRAIIALLVIVFFALSAIIFSYSNVNAELSKQVLTTLATLAIAVSSFYFGSKATEQGSKISQELFSQALSSTNPTAEIVPSAIIEEAIKNNKEQWLITYNCIDIIPGKKVTQQVTNETNCIVFVVKEKTDKSVAIPPTIPYTSANKTYTIPTDVQAQGDGSPTADNVTSDNIPETVLAEAISKKFDEWKQAFDIVAVSVGKKQISGQTTDVNCLVFSPIQKLLQDDKLFTPIPPIIKFPSVDGKIYDIPTDVRATGSTIQASATPALLCDNTVPKRPGCSTSRNQGNTTGTLGFVVYRNNVPHILSCYHVFCSPELNARKLNFKSTVPTNEIICSPGKRDNPQGPPLGKVIEGTLNAELDCALATIDDPLVMITERICNIDKAPVTPITVTQAHVNAHFKVKSVGRTTGALEGTIQQVSATCDINYKINNSLETVTLKGLISTNMRANSGDSGAPVVDNDNNAIGIIIATSSEFTYVLPIQRILAHFSITLKPTLS